MRTPPLQYDHRFFAPGTPHKIFPANRYEHNAHEPDGVVHAVPARTHGGSEWVPHRAPGEKTECGKLSCVYKGFDLLPVDTPITCPECLAKMTQP